MFEPDFSLNSKRAPFDKTTCRCFQINMHAIYFAMECQDLVSGIQNVRSSLRVREVGYTSIRKNYFLITKKVSAISWKTIASNNVECKSAFLLI